LTAISSECPEILEPLVTKAVLTSDEERNKLCTLLSKYKQAFSLSGELGYTTVVQHEIHIKEGVQPIKQQPRRIPFFAHETVDKCIAEMLAGPDPVIEA